MWVATRTFSKGTVVGRPSLMAMTFSVVVAILVVVSLMRLGRDMMTGSAVAWTIARSTAHGAHGGGCDWLLAFLMLSWLCYSWLVFGVCVSDPIHSFPYDVSRDSIPFVRKSEKILKILKI